MLKDKLAAEAAAIKAQTPQSIATPACSAASAVGRLLANLSPQTDPADVEALATLTEEERDRLAQLTTDLAGDPARAGRQLAALKLKVDNHVVRMNGLFAAIGEPNAAELRRLAGARETARQVAAAASGALFRDEPLPNIGTEAWRALWESARHYSEHEAYPGQAFPLTGAGDVCVLCQQDIAPDAAERLNRFEAFVRDDSQQRAAAARAAHGEAKDRFQAAAIPHAEARAIVATLRDELSQDGLAEAVRRQLIAARLQHRLIGRHHADPARPVVLPAITYSSQEVIAAGEEVRSRALALAAEAGSPERASMIAAQAELADRQWLVGVKLDVLAEIERLRQVAALDTAQRETATNRITMKSTETAQALVTDALRAQFAQDVASFNIAGLAVELQQKNSAQGIPRFKVALTRKPAATVGQVLSEGEHRCVALAAFMAELATAGNQSSIVFDDPVSSLDHMHREAVAKRLIAAAANRQVIVLTHDLAFLFELERAANDALPRAQVQIGSVTRGAEKAGFCRNTPPFKARRVVDITASLARQLENERRHHEVGDEDNWRRTVKSIAGDLRDTWEAAVEESVGHVIRRLSHKVNTPGLIKLTAVTAGDCESMRDRYGRCSEMLHSAAIELNRPLPRPEVLTAEIDALAAWAADLRQRQDAIR